MTWYELLNRQWKDRGLHSTDGLVSEAAIRAFEDKYSINMPSELRIYFMHVNGMSRQGGHDVDENGFSFMPLVKVKTVAAFSSEMGWAIGEGVGRETAFVFVNYLQWCGAYIYSRRSPRMPGPFTCSRTISPRLSLAR